MARSKGSANFAGSLEVLADAPIDSRQVVPTKADLTVASNFPYFYEGMPVYCKDEKKIYVLTGSSVTVAANWAAVGGDGKTEIQWGYLDSNVFYEESTHVTVIPAETDTVYVERNTKKIYEYDGTDYVELSAGIDTVVYQPGGSYAFASLPAPAAGTLGFVYDVTDDFTTTSDFREGAGIDYPAGTNVAVVNTGTSLSPVYKYDVLMGNLSGYQKKIQYAALPTAGADYVGKVFQYIGATGGGLVKGNFYECVEDDSTNPSTYSWETTEQPGLPAGGTEGQVLQKNSSADGDASWGDPSGIDAIPVFRGATNYTDGEKGLFPKPTSADVNKVMFGDGSFRNVYGANSGSTVIINTLDTGLYGQTVTLTDGRTTLTETMGNDGECVFTNVVMFGSVSVSASTAQNVESRANFYMTYFGTYLVPLTSDFATINITNQDGQLAGETIIVKFGGNTVATTAFDVTGHATVYVTEIGNYSITANSSKGLAAGSVTVSAFHTTETVNLEPYHVYAFQINMSDSNPATCVTPYESVYGCENLTFTPAHMDFANDVFDWGSWTGDEFFFPKPCMLKYNGTVDYYLDKNDYTKKEDGVTPSDVADINYGGNVMVEFPTIYFKRWQNGDVCYCIISNKQLDADFHAYAHHDKNGDVLPYIYIAAYDGVYDGTRLRSISGKGPSNNDALTSGYIMCKATRQQAVSFAQANNSSLGSNHEGHYTWHKADLNMIQDLLFLLGMNTNIQATFGRGRDHGYVSISNTGQVATGSMNTKGMFWGENAGAAGVKVFGIENFWANIWKAVAGWINANGTQKTKMTYGKEDGSNVIGFNFDGTNYVSISGATPTGTSGECISKYKYSKEGFVPYTASGSDSTYVADGLWFNNSQNNYALAGGDSNKGMLRCGALSTLLYYTTSISYWTTGAALSYK